MKLHQIIERHWYRKSDLILTIILFPLSLIYELIIKIRKILFKLNLKPATRLKVPVIIIGNISVGGVGKTPLTKYLAQKLTCSGIKIGIILRGYKRNNVQPRIVTAIDDSKEVGDEALIYAQAGFKVAVGAKRVQAGELLLQKYPDIQLILADDGMQHYYLARDLEICVVDGTRFLGNQKLLPLGPLREPVSRLKDVDFIVINGNLDQGKTTSLLAQYNKPIIRQNLDFECFYNPLTKVSAAVADINQQDVIVMAAIGNPQRFFNYLKDIGLNFTKVQIFSDHYQYKKTDIAQDHTIITTEKDYTKLAKFANKNIWITKVSVNLDSNLLVDKITSIVSNSHQ